MADPIAFEIEGVGRFVAKPRTIAVDMAVERERCIQLAGVDSPSEDLLVLALVWAEAKQGLQQHPEGWRAEDQPFEVLAKVYAAQRSALDRFRQSGQGPGEGTGQGA